MYIDEEKLIFCFDEIFNSIPVDDIKVAVNCNRSNFKTEYKTALRMNKEDGQFLLKKYGPKMIELSKDKNYWMTRKQNNAKIEAQVPLLLEGFSYQDLILQFIDQNGADMRDLTAAYDKLMKNSISAANEKLHRYE